MAPPFSTRPSARPSPPPHALTFKHLNIYSYVHVFMLQRNISLASYCSAALARDYVAAQRNAWSRGVNLLGHLPKVFGTRFDVRVFSEMRRIWTCLMRNSNRNSTNDTMMRLPTLISVPFNRIESEINHFKKDIDLSGMTLLTNSSHASSLQAKMPST